MQYLGSKNKIGLPLTRYMQPFVDKATAYVEPFVGSASIISRIHHPVRYGSDINQALITLYKALQDGWEPPTVLTEEEWWALKQKRDKLDPLTAFAGFGCSYGGLWFHTYARDGSGKDLVMRTRNSLLNRKAGCAGVIWSCIDYKKIVVPDGAVVYCDPPYDNTYLYEATGKFVSTSFWAWVRDIGEHSTVFVSEYTAPPDIKKVFSITKNRSGFHNKKDAFVEREESLFSPNEIDNIQLRKTKPIGLLSRRGKT